MRCSHRLLKGQTMQRRNFLASIPTAVLAVRTLLKSDNTKSVEPVIDELDELVPGYIKDTYTPGELKEYKKELDVALKSNMPLSCYFSPVVYGKYPKGWSKPIGVSYQTWELGTLVEIKGVVYTVIELTGPTFGESGQHMVWLDRPLETAVYPEESRLTTDIKIVGQVEKITFVSRPLRGISV